MVMVEFMQVALVLAAILFGGYVLVGEKKRSYLMNIGILSVVYFISDPLLTFLQVGALSFYGVALKTLVKFFVLGGVVGQTLRKLKFI